MIDVRELTSNKLLFWLYMVLDTGQAYEIFIKKENINVKGRQCSDYILVESTLLLYLLI